MRDSWESEWKFRFPQRKFYIPHRAVVGETTQIAKVITVYDATAKANPDCVSLKYCLETGPSLRNMIWGILVRSSFSPILLCWNIDKASFKYKSGQQKENGYVFIANL